jgi:hypothetical protein
MNITTLPMK